MIFIAVNIHERVFPMLRPAVLSTQQTIAVGKLGLNIVWES